MSLGLSSPAAGREPRSVSVELGGPSEATSSLSPVAFGVWHSLAWLVFANGVGVLMALLLVAPRIDSVLGQWTYGRWMPVHTNAQLYGWCSLPLVAFLFRVYGADRGTLAVWCRPILWIWSCALGVGALSWVTGHSSGKLFLDWTGYSRILFPLALVTLWVLLVSALVMEWKRSSPVARSSRLAKTFGLVLLLPIPVLLYAAASPDLYPSINPDSGGPTGVSQLESALLIVAILLLLPFGLTQAKERDHRQRAFTWCVFAAEVGLCLALGRADASHHEPAQYLSLASLLIWIPLTPLYYQGFDWDPQTRRWRIAFLCWWSVLVPTGWSLFLPGVLDHFKFTDGLVAHSLLAMAGFSSSLLIFVMVQLLGSGGWIFNRPGAFWVWHASVLAYIILMFAAGWREGADPAFTLSPGTTRNGIYVVRLLLGILMFGSSLAWLVDASKLVREYESPAA